MFDWKRSTREAAFEQFSEDVKAQIQEYIKLYNLRDILSDAPICIETHSEKGRQGFFRSAETIRHYAIATPRWLVWAIREKESPVVLSALLNDVVIQDYADTPFVKLVPDCGIQVTGKFTDVAENASAFLGLEENTAGNKFKEVVIRAVQDAKK